MKKTKTPFRPRARILELLGEQLIKNHTLALFELIKNSYDADAKQVILTLLDIENSEGEIEIQDDGIGMDFDTVKNIWMEPAHGHKAESREAGIKTSRGRLPIGEKGVGRFAVHRLAQKISLVTKSDEFDEVVVDINWKDIESKTYLDDAKIEIRERKAEVFKNNKTGTRITLSGLKQRWRRGDIRRLYRSVFSMTSPDWRESVSEFDEVVPLKRDIFKVKFDLDPQADWLEGLIKPEVIREQAMFFYDFLIDDFGFSWRYRFKPLAGLESDFKNFISSRNIEGKNEMSFEFFNLKPPKEGDKWRGRHRQPRKGEVGNLLRELGVGPIRGRIAGFDLDKEILANYLVDDNFDSKRYDKDGLIKFLRVQGGIKVYRDGMRVYNYGEEGNDWLGLDHRRFQRPAKRLSNNLVLGEIYLNLEESLGLKEQTNREGFIENEAYQELKYAILCALIKFEVEREKDKDKIKKCFESKKTNIKKPKGRDVEESIQILKQKIIEKNSHEELFDQVKYIEKTYIDTRDVLLSAVGSGLGLTTVFHEIERGVRGLYRAIENDRPINDLLSMAKSLNELLKGSTYLVSKNERQILNASEIVQYALFSTRERFEYHNIPFGNGFDSMQDLDFKVKGIRRMYTASLVNLIDNSIHWVKMNSGINSRKDQLIWIGPSHEFESPGIIVADSGPGFEDDPEDLVKPFFTRRSEGMGIGLYYCNMVMKSHGGRLAFPNNNDHEIPKLCDGAVVAMVFNN